MKKLRKMILIIVILSLFLLSSGYFIEAYEEKRESTTSQINGKEAMKLASTTQVENTDQAIQELAIEDIVIRDKKYTTEYEADNGEKFTIIGQLAIPKIGIEYDILSTTSPTLLKISLNRYWGVEPNKVGNMCVVGHNYLDARFFGKLHTLHLGDKIKVTDSFNATITYSVYDKFIADPYDTRCTSQLTNGKKEITLITCYNKGTQRLVVKARAEKQQQNLYQTIIEKWKR